jgi:peptide/nickel transport system substrate-binding protein
MNLQYNKLSLVLLIGLLVVISACSPDNNEIEDFSLNIRLPSDPARLNPMVGNPSFETTTLNSLLFLPLAHYDPISYELSPIMITALKPGEKIEEGEYAGGIKYEYEIVPEAVWDDGKPVTGEDYLFTLKVAKHPLTDAAAWRGILQDIKKVEIDKQNPKKFTVTIGQYFHLAREASCTFDLYPKHIYDPEGIMDKYELALFNDAEELGLLVLNDSLLIQFANDFNGPKYAQEIVSGSGSYLLKNWEVDQFIAMERKVNYWGEKYPERLLLANKPKELIFRIIADENAAITLLKDGSIDLINVKDANAFDNLKASENFEQNYSISTPPLLRYYYIGLNNRVPELNDKDVRRAIAHLIDVDNIIKTLENGYATRQVGAIVPSSPFFNKALEEIDFDPEKAITILDAEGWKDTDNDGVRDKTIRGNKIDMEITYLASQSPLGQKVGLLFQDAAKEAGVKVSMEIKEGRQMSQALYAHDFEASASATGLSLAPYDPYQRWHSDNSATKGNVFGYVNDENDALIEKIRTTEDFESRKEAYLEFQELMYEEQPAVFLYSPTQKFVLNNKYKGVFSSKRPGFVPGAFELKK